MSLEALYHGALRQHFRQPHNRGGVADCSHSCRVDNPLCGDQLEVGVDVADGRIQRVRFQARGCAICIASGSLMTAAVEGIELADADDLTAAVHQWFSEAGGDEPTAATPESLHCLRPVRDYPTRWRCVTLAWEGLAGALGKAAGREQ